MTPVPPPEHGERPPVRLIYAANARIPSEKAHPYQIVQMCEAFADAGTDVTLLYARRRNPPDLNTLDVWEHYSIRHNFAAERIPCLDLYPLAWRLHGGLAAVVDRLATAVEIVTYHLSLLIRLAREREAIIYSRDAITAALIAFIWPRRARHTFFEAHTYASTRAGDQLRRWLARHVGGLIVITGHLHERYAAIGVLPDRLIVAHDGFRPARFTVPGDRAHWRRVLGWPADAFVVGYMGRFHTLGMDKGLSDLADAVAALGTDGSVPPVRLALVGGPAESVEALRERLRRAGQPPDLILYAGQVPAAEVPGYLRAFNVCAMPFPWTEHFAYYASPMKLFEYMASGSPLVASDLPSTAEIIRDGENGLLYPPGDKSALIAALRRLRDDPALAARLAAQAAQDVHAYAWEVRARRILDFIQSVGGA